MSDNKRHGPYLREPLKFVCPCGLPLEITQLETGSMEKKTEWVVGHLASNCSPVAHGGSLREVLSLLADNFLKYGRMPTREEYLAETDKSMLEYQREQKTP